MSRADARELLGLGSRGRLSRKAVEAAYAQAVGKWTSRMNTSFTLKERQRASDALGLLQSARTVCLPKKGSRATPASPAAKVQDNGEQIDISIFDLVMLVVDVVKAVLLGLWRVVLGVIGCVRAVVRGCKWFFQLMWRVVLVMADAIGVLESKGIPKAFQLIVLALLLLLVVNGCINMVEAIPFEEMKQAVVSTGLGMRE